MDRVLRFGPFELEVDAGILRKHGVRLKLQAQPLQILTALLEQPGAVIAREDLRRRLWREDTFVDFEHGLNAAVTRLRQALCDSADNPRYIETIAKRGYRFIAEVDRPCIAEIAPKVVPAQISEQPRPQKRRFAPWVAGVAVIVTGAVGAAIYLVPPPPNGAIHSVPLTTFTGTETNPALSPDGRTVAFAWNGDKEDNFDIYTMPVGSDTPLRLTVDSGYDASPAWSPDGKTIAFLRRRNGRRGELLTIHATGGPEQKIADVRSNELRPPPEGMRLLRVAWSPDGKNIAVANREPDDASDSIYLFALNGSRRRLTNPPSGHYGDHMPAFSPDGRTLAFCHLIGFSASEIHIVHLNAALESVGDRVELTTQKQWSVSPAWTSNGRSILYVFGARPLALATELRIIDTHSGRARPEVIPLRDDVQQVSVGRHLVYSKAVGDHNIWRAALPAPGKPPSLPDAFIASTQAEFGGRYSPDGSRIVYTSARSGSLEVWVSRADGSGAVRLTSFGGPLVGPPRWSPDGLSLVFHARPEGQADIFVIAASGGSPRRLTNEPTDETLPSYSRDGRWIYFGGLRSGEHQIWRIPAEGGQASQITTGGGSNPIESTDGKMVYFSSRSDHDAIKQIPVAGGAETEVVALVRPMPYGFALTDDGVYYPAPSHAPNQSYIRFFSFATRKSHPVVQIPDRHTHYSMDVSPDRQYLLVSMPEKQGIDLMLVRNFAP